MISNLVAVTDNLHAHGYHNISGALTAANLLSTNGILCFPAQGGPLDSILSDSIKDRSTSQQLIDALSQQKVIESQSQCNMLSAKAANYSSGQCSGLAGEISLLAHWPLVLLGDCFYPTHAGTHASLRKTGTSL